MSILTDSTCGVVLSSEGERVLIDMIACGVKKTATMTTAQTGRGRGKVHILIYIVQCMYGNLPKFYFCFATSTCTVQPKICKNNVV